jgi:hypothetical protein
MGGNAQSVLSVECSSCKGLSVASNSESVSSWRATFFVQLIFLILNGGMSYFC